MDISGHSPANRDGVVVVGSANMDLVVNCERFPDPGETLLARRFDMFPGGKGANQAVACARLGSTVHFIGKMGDDVFRDQLVKSLGENGVNLERLKIDPIAPTGIAVITVDSSGQNQIIVSSGSNMSLRPDEVEEEADVLAHAKVVLLQLEVPLDTVERSARLAKEGGATVILNPAPAAPLSDSLLGFVDLITPNMGELEVIAGVPVRGVRDVEGAARTLVGRGVDCVVVTMGEQGALSITAEKSHLFQARRVDAVDTTAAGDAFNGALAHSLAAGHPLDKGIELANAVAAYAVTKPGAQPSMPTMHELQLSFAGASADAGKKQN
ncbi:MAG: ribokinase [Rhodothermales bacterium]|nr:ribokinase [Rhodothermales bacterium]